MTDFELELKQGFLEEAAQLLADAEQAFLELENNPNSPGQFDKILRLAHSLKGSAKAVGFEDMGKLTHEMESLLLKVKKGNLTLGRPMMDLLLRCNDQIRAMLEGLKADLNARFDCSSLLGEIEAAMQGAGAVATAGSAGSAPALDQNLPTAGMQAEELLANFENLAETTRQHVKEHHLATKAEAPASSSGEATPSPAAAPTNKIATTEESIRVNLGRVEQLLNYVGELVILQTVLREQAHSSGSALIRSTTHQLGKVTQEIQDLSMGLRMVPIKPTFLKMQRIVRDTAGQLGREVIFEMVGEETELDKTVLERLSDPLVHIVRNAVDHGIEDPRRRFDAGKPTEGKIRLSARQQAGQLVIEISDDGGGMDANKLRRKAIEKGVISPNAQLSDSEAYQLIFAAGFSTKEQVTDISGRGVGMDVVKTNIQALQGTVQVETELGKGSTFRIRLPLTLAIIQGMIIRCGTERFVIPLSQVLESVRPSKDDITPSTIAGEVLSLRGQTIPLFRLEQLLGRRTTPKPAHDSIAILYESHGKNHAVLVDDIVGQHQVVIKKLGSEVAHVKAFSGSAILGDGKPALILELSELTSGTAKRTPVHRPLQEKSA